MNNPTISRGRHDIFDTGQQSYAHESLSGFTWGGLLGLLIAAVYFFPLLIEILDRNSITARTITQHPAFQRMIGLTRSKIGANPFGLNPTSSEAARLAPQGAQKPLLKTVFGIGKSAVSAARGATSDGAPRGLGNWDNSCYQNSVLQAFASLPSIRHFYDRVHNENDHIDNSSTFSALMELTKELNDTKQSSKYLWTPQKLKNMSSWQQQDAQEYFSRLVDEIERDVKVTKPSSDDMATKSLTSAKISAQRLGLAALVDSQRLAALKSTIVDVATRTSRLQNPLEGLLAQRVGCITCGYSDGMSLIPFNSLTLPLGKNWLYDIQDCLNEVTSLEFIEGVECSKCTLLQARRRLRELLENLEADNRSGVDGDEGTTLVRQQAETQLEAINEALRDDDFSDATLKDKCRIPKKLRATSTKSRQAVVMRAPKCLTLHINRSVFDEMTGEQRKNYAEVRYSNHLDLGPWILGSKAKMELDASQTVLEDWEMNPSKPMNERQNAFGSLTSVPYQLRAVITHYGRHENGHYICYRSLPKPSDAEDEKNRALNTDEEPSQWWRISDENTYPVSDVDAHSQGGAFMLFYERTDKRQAASAPQLGMQSSNSSLRTAIEEQTIVDANSQFKHDSDVEVDTTSIGAREAIPAGRNSGEIVAADDGITQTLPFSTGAGSLQHDVTARHTRLESIPLRTAAPSRDVGKKQESFKPVQMVATT